MKSLSKILIYPLFVITITGCVNLKAVNDFAKSSKETIQTFKESDISLIDSYKHRTLNDCMFKGGKPNFIAKEDDCYDKNDIKRFKRSDSLITMVNTVLEKYFLALEELSAYKDGSFSLKNDNLTKILTDSTEFKFSEDQVKAATGLVENLTNSAFSVYKKKKIAKTVAEVHSDLAEVINMYKSALGLLKKNLKDNVQTSQNRYLNLFTNSRDTVQKIQVTDHYIKESREWLAKIKVIEKYIKALDEIATGHDKLLKNGKNITTKEIFSLLAGHTATIIEVRNDIKTLKDDE